jgi:hypothetical protein
VYLNAGFCAADAPVKNGCVLVVLLISPRYLSKLALRNLKTRGRQGSEVQVCHRVVCLLACDAAGKGGEWFEVVMWLRISRDLGTGRGENQFYICLVGNG